MRISWKLTAVAWRLGVVPTEAVICTKSGFLTTRPARAPTLAVLTEVHFQSRETTSTVPGSVRRPGAARLRRLKSCRTAGPRHHHPRHHPASASVHSFTMFHDQRHLSVVRHWAWIASLTHVRSSLSAKMLQAQLEHAAEMHAAQPRCSSVAVLITSSQKKKPR